MMLILLWLQNCSDLPLASVANVLNAFHIRHEYFPLELKCRVRYHGQRDSPQ